MDAAIPLHELTNRQLMFHLLNRTETLMADLNQSVADLQVAVDNVAARFQQTIEPLTTALEEAQAEVDALELENEADKAALQDALNRASSAADEINSQVTELNEIGTAGGGEEPDPGDEPLPEPEEPPADEPTA